MRHTDCWTRKKLLRPPNTDGWGNKLVTIFARHLDNFILTTYLSLIYLICDFGFGQNLQSRQFYLAPGFAKIAPCWLAARTIFWLKYQDSYRRTAPPTFTPSTAGPLGAIWDAI
ncbi:MAG: hypothetical protein A2X05_12695 [Bacteroidetes bacterium GWE2_41_25]|nr:MAG: hypothetical protein A2X05_12695 [Bacteroidetes bacterium GWE2_41_25]